MGDVRKDDAKPSGPRIGSEPIDFATVIKDESRRIDAARTSSGLPTTSAVPASIEIAHREANDEPWVAYTPFDRAGIALSGGGIRSSAFTLGLLQALAERGVLRLFDYLATVSGGGYTGGFWTSWARANVGGPSFPVPGSGCDSREHPAIRHLREHSRFLAPRAGLGYIDLWEAILSLVAGMIPTLVFATLLFATVVVAWRLLLIGVVGLTFYEGMSSLVVFLGWMIVGSAMELRWQSVRLVPKRDVKWGLALVSATITAATLAVVTWFAASPSSPVWFGDPLSPAAEYGQLFWRCEAQYPVSGLDWIRGYLLPAGFAIGAACVWLLRWIGALGVGWYGLWSDSAMRRRDDPTSIARALERASARLLFFALIALAFAAIWHLSMILVDSPAESLDETLKSIGVSGGLTALASGAFAALRNLLQPSREDDAAGLLARVRPLLPQLAAIAAVGLYVTSVTIVCRTVDEALRLNAISPWWWLTVPAAVVVLAGPDHRGSGLHEFYRRRISRAFVQYEGDELPHRGDVLQDDRLVRPVHLVCCAANGVSDDPLRTLYRGARSAVLSDRGLLIGRRAMPADIRLSDALTASAAAFNSQMGGYSVRLGAAVSILMGALNLRLGLWLRTTPRLTPLSVGGARLCSEMFGLTQSDQSWVHLSDGGHFDNTGAYELVRRHCRYVVLADCGADPKVRFDDISELIRRVREDFGVEIEIDVSPLRPGADGYSPQHVAVGKIFYGGRATNDVGTLIVVKPTLTGDEPPDVTQYHARNSAFPHESTGDQFFDEPQWESYRRLGEHTGRAVFSYVKELTPNQFLGGERVFTDAERQWHAMPARQLERIAQLSARCADLEQELRDSLPALRREFVPELSSPEDPTAPSIDARDEAREFMFFLEVSAVLEDIWLTCGLDKHAHHPMNEGWPAYIGRWVAMPSFVRMWPLLRPIAGPEFRELVKRRFGLRVRDIDEPQADGYSHPEGTAVLRIESTELAECATPRFCLVYMLELPGSPTKSTEVGRVTIEVDGERAKWELDGVTIPERMNGAGVVGRFLDAILAWCAKQGCTKAIARARIEAAGSLADYNRVLDLYRGRGFWLSPLGPSLQRAIVPPGRSLV